MGLELVKKAQALKFQGGNPPSTLVPGIVPKCSKKTVLSITLLLVQFDSVLVLVTPSIISFLIKLTPACFIDRHSPGRLPQVSAS